MTRSLLTSKVFHAVERALAAPAPACSDANVSKAEAQTILEAITREVATALGCSNDIQRAAGAGKQNHLVDERERFLTLPANLVCVLTYDGYFKDLSPAWSRLLGYPEMELRARSWLDFIHPDDRAIADVVLAELRDGRNIIGFRHRCVCEDGSSVWFLWSATAHMGDRLIYITATDITDIAEKQKESQAYLTKLQESYRQIKLQTVELKSSAQELTRARDVAEAATKAKADFLANISHELRTPMNGILGMTELALEVPSTDEQRGYLKTVKFSADSLLTVINDLLDYSKLEAGKCMLTREPFKLREFLHQLCVPYEYRASAKSVEMVVNVASTVPEMVVGDSVRLGQILINLLGNALKFTPNHGGILLNVAPRSLEQSSAVIHFAVADTGIGIDPSKIKQVFTPFTQADNSITRRYGGTGLGLSISKRIAELMGGGIWVKSRLTVGSTFHVVLPLGLVEQQATTDPRPTAPEEIAISTRTYDSAVAKGRILLAEDNVVNQTLATILLRRQGYEVTVVCSGVEVLARLEAEAEDAFQMILMDCQMPEMSGYEATQAIRELESKGRKRVPIIALTAHAMEGDRDRCIQSGMDDYLSKPIQKSEFQQVVARWIAEEVTTSAGEIGSD